MIRDFLVDGIFSQVSIDACSDFRFKPWSECELESDTLDNDVGGVLG